MLRARAQMLAAMRDFFSRRNVLEVQTPLLGQAGVTDPDIAAFELFEGSLQTSSEYHQKRLLAAGIGDNYSLGAVFRAGESGRLHNPEFTMLEWYRLGFDDIALRREVEDLVNTLLGPAEFFEHRYAQLVASVELGVEESRRLPDSAHADLRIARAIEQLGEGRHFVIDFPATEAGLARLDPVDPTVARRFELIIDGVEIANGYFELLDADTHRSRFAADREERRLRGLPDVTTDTLFLAAVESGLPDCAGVALGVDRLLMLQQGARQIADVQAFPWERR